MLGNNGGEKYHGIYYGMAKFQMPWKYFEKWKNTQIENLGSKENGILFSDVTETDGRLHFRRRPVTNSRL